MIMHPIMPTLNGKALKESKFNCALGEKKNLLRAIVDTCRKTGEGFVDYFLPRKAFAGTAPGEQMLSYVRTYKPFNWVVGTEINMKEIDALAKYPRGFFFNAQSLTCVDCTQSVAELFMDI